MQGVVTGTEWNSNGFRLNVNKFLEMSGRIQKSVVYYKKIGIKTEVSHDFRMIREAVLLEKGNRIAIMTKALSSQTLEKDVLQYDKKECMKFGPCGVGKKALYLSSFYMKRNSYVPFSAVQRVFKRVAGREPSAQGVFSAVVYLVVIYDGGKEKQCLFKRESDLDNMMTYIGKMHPEIPLVHAKAEAELAKKEALKAAKAHVELSREAEAQIKRLEQAKDFLEKRSDLIDELTYAAKRKRQSESANPMYRWAALVIVLAGVALGIYGIYGFIADLKYASYFLIFGLAIVFLFGRVLPTKRSSKTYTEEQWKNACEAVEKHIKGFGSFPVPARYAHPMTLARMIRVIREGRAQDAQGALEVVKDDLKKLNADVKVEQEEYEEVVAIKPMFLVEDYR